MTLLDMLPVIIDGPGEYLTRGGGRVTIHDVDGRGTFNARGSKWKMFRGKDRPRVYGIWHRSGRHMPLNEVLNDIVGKWEGL
jgi:hypothetical protein